MDPLSPQVRVATGAVVGSARADECGPCGGAEGERQEGAGASGAELRRWERTARRRTMQIQPLKGGRPERPVATRVVDFSAMGLGLIHSRRMSRGEQFVVPLGTLEGGAVPLLYSVVHCRGLKNGLYAIGAELVSVMDLKEFARVVPRGRTVAEYITELMQ